MQTSFDRTLPPGTTRLINIYSSALKTRPDKLAVIIGDQSCSYRKLDEMVDLYGRALSGIGVSKDSIVTIFMPNCLDIVWLFLACNRLGAIANMTSVFAQTEEVISEANSCQTSVMLVHSALYPIVENIQARVPSLNELFIVDAPADHTRAWCRAVRQAPPSNTLPEKLSEDQVAAIFYTSGSTATPKGVTHTHRSFFHAAFNRAVTFNHGPQELFALSAQLSHFLAYIALLPMLYRGGTGVFCDGTTAFKKFDAGAFIDIIHKHGITHVHAAPSQWRQVLEHPKLQRSHFAAVKHVYAGSDAVTSELQQEFKGKLGIPLSVTYGMTECSMIARASADPGPGEIGYPLHATSIRLVDESNHDVPLGEVGQIIVKSDSLMVGYWNDPANTACLLKNGWFYTGDLARQDDGGRYFFVGRCKNTIVRGGGNIAPEEVEEAICKHPAVKSCGVVGVPDAKSGQTIAAVIVTDDILLPPSIAELIEFLNPMISARKIPEYWYFADNIPVNSTAKVDRKQLAEQVQSLAGKLLK